MTPTSRRLAASALALGILLPLSGCGDNPFGNIMRGQDPNAATAPAETTEVEYTSGPPADTESPSESYTTGSPTDTATETVTDTMSPSPSTSSSMPGSPSSTVSETSPGSPAPTTPGPTSTSTRSASPAVETVQVDGRTIAGVPAGLGFPTKVTVEGTSSFEAGGGSVVMSAPAEDEIFSFYRSTLPSGGYRIVGDTAGTITFTGRGFRGSLMGTGQGAVLTWAPASN